MFGFLGSEFQVGAQPDVIFGADRSGMVQDKGKDEFLDQQEHRQVGVRADLIEQQTVARPEKLDARATRQGVRQETTGEVEGLIAADQILHAPGDALGPLKTFVVGCGHAAFRERLRNGARVDVSTMIEPFVSALGDIPQIVCGAP